MPKLPSFLTSKVTIIHHNPFISVQSSLVQFQVIDASQTQDK
ncbi:hypothetical protein FOXG_18450 [Fusarium oxysporum f. sp. lycopersici 4287]|uniref:Uncharacterized protein n=2 Tax=Fusarium oxysporum TaxID=5507 RepID=A0A0J9UKM4_FUSO4|nr:hypothetical protein FOXG_18450 [Fusarium oxysporum f. sp. lycopersici 4287]EXK33871.1 hypothetical protein FOMG_11079 [Fusarium oxysporum f. sp. melonis 26406]KNA98700.1 hypothetical protein FOXG_18450 [Fusarium oxysporum f. sp. lycopersici 4287]